jgi:hypothetical protein
MQYHARAHNDVFRAQVERSEGAGHRALWWIVSRKSLFLCELHWEVWCIVYPRNGMITTRQRPLRFLDAKPARKNAPRACAVCAARKVSCDVGRPCKRCVKAHIEHLCVDVETKRRTTKRAEPGDSNETDSFSLLDEAIAQVYGEGARVSNWSLFQVGLAKVDSSL